MLPLATFHLIIGDFLITGQVTGISDVESLYSVPAALFDLQGRRIVGTPKRGIYVKDGRKKIIGDGPFDRKTNGYLLWSYTKSKKK